MGVRVNIGDQEAFFEPVPKYASLRFRLYHSGSDQPEVLRVDVRGLVHVEVDVNATDEELKRAAG